MTMVVNNTYNTLHDVQQQQRLNTKPKLLITRDCCSLRYTYYILVIQIYRFQQTIPILICISVSQYENVITISIIEYASV